jgi:hypothetical protein
VKILTVCFAFLLVGSGCTNTVARLSGTKSFLVKTAIVRSLDTTAVNDVSVYFNFEVDALNFDFYPSDISCTLDGGTFQAVGEVTNEKIDGRKLSPIGSFKVNDPSRSAKLICNDHANRNIELFIWANER